MAVRPDPRLDGIPNDGPGWRVAVHELIFHLEEIGGYWWDYADRLNRLLPRRRRLDSVPDGREDLAQEQDVLNKFSQVLAGIDNHSLANISKSQQRLFKVVVRRAVTEVANRTKAIRRDLEEYDRAVDAAAEYMATMPPNGFDGQITHVQTSSDAQANTGPPFDHLGPKTRRLLCYLWDEGRRPRRAIPTVMKMLGYSEASTKGKRAFAQLRARANNDLLALKGPLRYEISKDKKANAIFIAEVPS
jgi:PAS domain-containing protein